MKKLNTAIALALGVASTSVLAQKPRSLLTHQLIRRLLHRFH